VLPCLHRVDHVTSVTSQYKYNRRNARLLNTTTTMTKTTTTTTPL